jgi:hypothetical protein
MQHSFDIDIASEYGMLEAVLINNFWYWIEKNRANGVNYHEGRYWTYNSTKALCELFPYATEKKIKYALKRLREEDILMVGNFNKAAYDRTLWYAFTDKGYGLVQNGTMHRTKSTYSIGQNGTMDRTKWDNALDTGVRPIPNINTNIKPYINTKEGWGNEKHKGYNRKQAKRDGSEYAEYD